VVQVTQAVQLTLTVAGLSKHVTLRVLPSTADDAVAVLFGRYLLELFDVETRGATLVRRGKSVLFRAERIRRVSDSREPVEQQPLGEGIYDLESHPRAPSDPVVLPVTAQDDAELKTLLDEVVALGPIPLSHCPATMTLRRLSEADKPDTPDQKFAFQLSMRDAPPFTGRQRLYAGAMFRKLNAEQIESARSLIKEYVSAGWWTPLTSAPTGGRMAANVFAVPKGRDRIRLVCDLREYNTSFPSTVAHQPRIPFLLLNLRTIPTSCSISVGDCRAAFYKVRLAQPLWLHCGEFGDFDCHRMIFGLSSGPEGLEASLGLLWRLFLATSQGTAGGLFVDDFWLKTTDRDQEARWYCGIRTPALGQGGSELGRQRWCTLG
jgi:hypothetical protein